MPLRTAFFTSLLALYGLTTFPSASGLSCYVQDCIYYPGEDPDCSSGGVAECLEEDDDRCGSLSVSLGSGIHFTKLNCTRSNHDDCNEQKNCDRMREMAVAIEDTIESCSVTCCDTAGCNSPAKKKHDKEMKTITKKFHWPQ